jgi:HSP20 family protein
MSTDTLQQSQVNAAERTTQSVTYKPLVDILERGDELVIYAEMPGVSPDSIDVHFEDRTLEIRGRVAARQGAGTTYLLQEYGVGDFHRVFQVSEVVDAAKICAEYTNGILVIHLPKIETVRPRKIDVQLK